MKFYPRVVCGFWAPKLNALIFHFIFLFHFLKKTKCQNLKVIFERVSKFKEIERNWKI